MKTMIKMMLLASTVMMTSCLADDPFSEDTNNLAAVLLQQAN